MVQIWLTTISQSITYNGSNLANDDIPIHYL